MIIIPIILIIIALLLVLAVGFWQTIIIVVLGAGIFAIVYVLFKKMISNPFNKSPVYQP